MGPRLRVLAQRMVGPMSYDTPEQAQARVIEQVRQLRRDARDRLRARKRAQAKARKRQRAGRAAARPAKRRRKASR